MEKIKQFLTNYYTKDKEIDIALFKILGTAGIMVSLVAGTQSILSGVSVIGGLIDYVAVVASIILLWFVDKTGNYVLGYILTDLLVFMGLFAMLFFEMGGMEGSMMYFFVFGIVFVFLMFRGKLLIIMEILQVAFYTFLCVYAIRHPDSVTPFASDTDRFIDQLSGLLLSGVAIGLIFLVYIAQYRKQQELAEEANLAKSRFLAGMSHEIRTPINMMLGMNEMIIREAENASIKEYATDAEEAGKQLLFMVNQVLQYSKLEVGKDELVLADYSFTKMITGLKTFFEKEASKKNLDFLLCVDEEIACVLKGDVRKISQILTNLLTNAIKYTNEGSVTLIVKNLGRTKEIQKLGFRVQDTGIGIEDKDIKRIFESFERTDLLKNRNVEGTGLGLAIAGNLARLMNSEIQVTSEYGKGSTFGFEIVQKIGTETGDLEEETQESFVAPEAKILVVDDNIMNLNVVKSLLKKTMLQVETAGSAKECYEKCKKECFDLIFMDLMMPEIDGLEAMKHLQTMEKCKDVPIVVLTADVTSGTRERLLSEGFDGYLSKPIDWKELEECLMSKLPEELVVKTRETVKEILTEEEERTLINILKHYDMELSEGLHYMGGDVLQYAKVAEYFVTNADAGMERFKACMEEGNFQDAIYLLHSLKGNARNVGSVELHYLSKRLEKRCREDDKEYVLSGAELLLFEWQRVKDGLVEFLSAFKPIRMRLEEHLERTSDASQATLQNILEAIENYRQIPAVELIDQYLADCDDEKTTDALRMAKEKIAQIDFDEAEGIVQKILDK